MDAFIDEVDDAKKYVITPPILFWPAKWRAFSVPGVTWQWKSVPFRTSSIANVPDASHGVYSFSISPLVADHPYNSFLIYIGKADAMSLRARFKSYFIEAENAKRPSIGYMFKKYKDNLFFCYVEISNSALISKAEDSLLSALIPICNHRLPAEVSRVIRGIR